MIDRSAVPESGFTSCAFSPTQGRDGWSKKKDEKGSPHIRKVDLEDLPLCHDPDVLWLRFDVDQRSVHELWERDVQRNELPFVAKNERPITFIPLHHLAILFQGDGGRLLWFWFLLCDSLCLA